ncbi:conserved hypothetical protein [Methanothermobacter sp. CaT2]|uniref:transglutaminase domain-containing protein n=1 Tax=Methanothermobacter sp. CaT2 TaxID=866790 RepID=UPI0002CCF379|nr:transglutaminase domain-containing protein [Methanothermobacter sp. CaT2]BAM69960.1 conserved hypothetical protein [Methanothermobacter sp. CaT2]
MRQLQKASVYLTMTLILIVAMESSHALENYSGTLNSSEVLQASVRVANFMEKYQRLPENISAGNRSLDCASYTYALSRVLRGSRTVEYRTVNSPALDIRRISLKLSRTQYNEITVRFRDFTDKYSRCPSTVSYTGGKIDFYNTVYLLSKIGRYRYQKGRMPTYVYIRTPVPLNAYRINSQTVDSRIRSINSEIRKTSSLIKRIRIRIRTTGNTRTRIMLQNRLRSLENRYTYLKGQLRYYEGLKNSPWYVPPSLKRYLSSTAYCSVTDPNVVYLARELSGNTSYSTAQNLFTWVLDNVDYSFYYRTRYGASGTLRLREGNCVDQAHLMVALARTSGIPARYVRGYCRFISGNWYSHVWAQVWIRGRGWVTADTTHSLNRVGHVSNWNTTVSRVSEVLSEYRL